MKNILYASVKVKASNIEAIQLNAATRLLAASLDPLLNKAEVRILLSKHNPFDCPDDWIIMNAPRHLIGTKTSEGEFVAGRHYAAIDPQDTLAKKYIEDNLRNNAVVVLMLDQKQKDALLLKLIPEDYKEAYMEDYEATPVSKRSEFLTQFEEYLKELTYTEIKKKLALH